jgi:hypothetical protein
MMQGHVTVCKVYKDGTEEIVVDESNMITAGLHDAFLDILHQAGSPFAEDYRPRYYQFGTGTNTLPSDDTSSIFFGLSSPLTWSEYGSDSDMKLQERYRVFPVSGSSQVQFEDPTFSAISYSGTDEYFAEVGGEYSTRIFYDSFEAILTLDTNSGNGETISEAGLFAKNPKGYAQDSPYLMAYKSFSGISKTSDFSLIIRWNIGYVGISDTVDTKYNGQDYSHTTRLPNLL